MAKSNLTNMSVDGLLKLRAEVGAALSRRAKDLESQLSRLGGEIGSSSLLKNSKSHWQCATFESKA